MVKRHHEPRWDSILRVGRLLVTMVDEIVKLTDAFRHVR
jgi:hypothetical protein